MGSSASIAQEYYKVQDYWAEVDSNADWRLAIWVAQYPDIDILDKFMEVERSPLGIFGDIFFRFETPYKGDDSVFEKSLWEEYIEWFTEKVEPSTDIMLALKNEGLLLKSYFPDTNQEATAANLWKELLRFKSCIEGIEEERFCIYFPPTRVDAPKLTDWFSTVLKDGVPKGIRLVTIDYAEHRKVKLRPSSQIILLEPELNMIEAIKNDMDKDSNNYDTVGVENRFRKQIREVMDCSLKKNNGVMDRETAKLLSLSKEMGSVSALISALMITSHAYYSINNQDQCKKYAEEAIIRSEEAIKNNDPTGYPIWKAATLLKGAVLAGRKHRREAIEVYTKLAEEAADRIDVFYAMEGYRLSGTLYYELGEINTAFETTLLALVSGSHLDIDTRRQSTFLQAAALALYLGNKCRGQSDMKILEKQLSDWLGNDWKDLVETEEMSKVKERRKSSIFS
ncbi:MAG: hypothetical protein LBT25_12305 [Candidatus Symbiothrix sp.]|jgi:tetratricopeptide (TPR) repeat protein|nr:hypothetical protein [Candidatus Symbiothrix sp.]